MNNKMSKKISILFLTNVPSPYRVEFFNELNKYTNTTVLFEKKQSDERDPDWRTNEKYKFKAIYLSGISTSPDKALCINVIKYINKSYDYIIICGVSTPTQMLAIRYCQIRKIPYCIEGDGAILHNENKIKRIIKTKLIKHAKLCFSTCKEHEKYYKKYGATDNNIVKYIFSSVKKSEISDLKDIKDIKNINKAKQQLGIKEKQIIICVGQFIYRKGIDILLKSAKYINKDVGIYIIGGTQTNQYVEIIKQNKLENVHFFNFMNKEQLSKYYAISNIFVLPTREDIWGLVINEAMAHGLPVITTDKCNAGLELVEQGKNGYIIQTNSPKQLSDKINEILKRNEYYKINSLSKIKEYTIENMVASHMEILNKYLEK